MFTGILVSKKRYNNSDKAKAKKCETIGVKKPAIYIKYSQDQNIPETNVRFFRDFCTWNNLLNFRLKIMVKKTKKRGNHMDKVLFNELKQQTKMKKRSIQMARRVLVDGKSFSAVAREYGVTRQRTRQAALRITQQEKIVSKIPNDWKTKTVVLPNEWTDVIGYIDSKVREKQGVHVRTKREKPELDPEMIAILASVLAGK